MTLLNDRAHEVMFDGEKFFITIARLLKLANELAPGKFINQKHIAKALHLTIDEVTARMDNAERWCIRFFKKCFCNEHSIGYRFAESPSDAVIELTKTNLRGMAQMRSLILTFRETQYDYASLKEENEEFYELFLHNKMLSAYMESALLTQEKILRELSDKAQSLNRKAMCDVRKPFFFDGED